MSEIWVRAALVAAALAVIAVVTLFRHRRRTVRTVKTTDLAPGTYLFTSASCSTCARARAKLDESLGRGGYQEFAWESRPEMFETYEIDRVPATMVVETAGRGRVVFGQPDRS